MQERVQKLISNAGFCSRRQAEEFIERGKVRVNGKVIHLGDKADIEKDEIYVGSALIEKTQFVYIMLNKPKGYEVTMSPNIKKNVLNLVQVPVRVFPVGRLDKGTTGLLLLTNDGNFANKVMHPRYEKEKTYYVQLDKHIEKRDIEELEKGIHLQDGFVKGKIKLFTKTTLEITIREGKKWIVKRMFFKQGYFVKDLARSRIGNLKMDVKLGKWRFLKDKEVKELMK